VSAETEAALDAIEGDLGWLLANVADWDGPGDAGRAWANRAAKVRDGVWRALDAVQAAQDLVDAADAARIFTGNRGESDLRQRYEVLRAALAALSSEDPS